MKRKYYVELDIREDYLEDREAEGDPKNLTVETIERSLKNDIMRMMLDEHIEEVLAIKIKSLD